MERGRIDRPVALDRPQLCRRLRNRGNGDFLRIKPDIRRPCCGARRPRSDQKPAMPDVDGAKLVCELFDKPFGGKIGGANGHRASISRPKHLTPRLARRGTFAKLAACRSISKLPISPKRSHDRAGSSSLPVPASAPSREL